jgi:uncharacterized protein (TIGR00369 family)
MKVGRPARSPLRFAALRDPIRRYAGAMSRGLGAALSRLGGPGLSAPSPAQRKGPFVYDAIRSGMIEAVPFARYLGIELLEVGDGFATAQLDQRPNLSNHIGTMHAGALFTLAETASGAAMAGAFADLIGSIRPVASDARIAFLKLAKGKLTCTARTVDPADALRRRLRDEGKVVFDVLVDVFRESGQRVATLTVTWHVRSAEDGQADPGSRPV